MIDDEIGNQFFDLLENKVKEGVEVKLLVDYFGSFLLSRKKIDHLRKAGVDIRYFIEKRINIFGFIKRAFARTHRKVLVIDGEIGYIGGVNIQKYMEDWLDIHLQIKGKVVRTLLRAFAKSYLISGGERKKIQHLFVKENYQRERGNKEKEVNFIFDEAKINESYGAKKYVEALWQARERVILFSPYYFPDKPLLQALWQARKRGVKVDLLIPFRADMRMATYMAYTWFSLMKKIGVNVHLSKKMMHGKGVIVDDNWAMIGSSNIDPLSFYSNYEANVKIKNTRFVNKLRRTVDRWLVGSYRLEDLNWEKRSWWHKLKEKISVAFFKLIYPRQ